MLITRYWRDEADLTYSSLHPPGWCLLAHLEVSHRWGLLSPLRGDTRYTNHHFPLRRLWEQLRRLMKLDKVGQVNSDGFLYVNKSGVCRFWCSSWSCTASWTWRTWRYSGPQSLENTARDISIWTEITGAADGKYIYGYHTTDNIQVSAGKNDHGKTIFEGNPWN